MTQAIIVPRSLGGFSFDAVFQERHSSDLTVTDNPVETGARVSDHAYTEPKVIEIQAGVSDTPLNEVAGDAFSASVSRSVRAYELLLELQAKAEPFDVQTGLKLYKNMVVVGLRATQDKDTALVLAFEATLREVSIVSTQSVEFTPRRTNKTKRQADPKKTGGEQQGGDVPEEKKSLLKKLAEVLRK